MKVLYYRWGSYMNHGVEEAFKRLDVDVHIIEYQLSDWEDDALFLELFRKEVKQVYIDYIFSVNFVPLISKIAEEIGIPYISWIYDAPLHIRNLEPLKNSCNQVYFFDRCEQEKYRAMGVNAHYLPLASDISLFQNTIKLNNDPKYKAQVSMVGNLYHTEYNGLRCAMDKYDAGYLDAIINAQLKIYGACVINEVITSKVIERLNRALGEKSNQEFKVNEREIKYLLQREVTNRERIMGLALLSRHFDTILYSNDECDALKQVRAGGPVDYMSEMPCIFANSEINLNITLRGIVSGIPLRVLDIMGCNAFVLSNYQEDLMEYFLPEQECVVYTSLEEMYEKSQFYIEHIDERKKIALRAFERVKRDFTFEERMRTLLKM